MLALSTSFISTSIDHGAQLLQTLTQYGISYLELDCRITRNILHQVKENLSKMNLQVCSLHNYCPFPQLKLNVPPGGDYFPLSSTDREERRTAVQWTIKTIEQANELEAMAVVLHCGAVAMSPCHDAVYSHFQSDKNSNTAYQELRFTELQRRKQQSRPYLDALLFSLDRLLPSAQKHGIVLGLETRYHYFELPSFDEMALILNEFDGAPVGYWHDTGHAYVQEQLGIVSKSAWLKAYGSRLVGLHVHDAVGLVDHLAPGHGEIDFEPIQKWISPERPLVIELSPGTARSDVAHAVAWVKGWMTGG